MAYIDGHKQEFGVEPICTTLQVAPSTYYAAKARQPCAWAVRDAQLKAEIRRIYDDNFKVYGARKVWLQLRREDVAVARCTVARLMADMGIAGVVRGKPSAPPSAVRRPPDAQPTWSTVTSPRRHPTACGSPT